MTKYYKVVKDNFLWDAGAIISYDAEQDSGYTAIDDIFNKFENQNEYISPGIIEEAGPEYFQRVYKVNLLTKAIYETKEKAKELLEKDYKSKGGVK